MPNLRRVTNTRAARERVDRMSAAFGRAVIARMRTCPPACTASRSPCHYSPLAHVSPIERA
jgi:hypothetical protein